jgi:hypothetical protein
MLGARLGVVGILAREDVKVLTVYVDLSVICVICYQQDLAQQQTQLQDLQAKLEDDIGFIEQIDIDEMSELVGDLQADKKYCCCC